MQTGTEVRVIRKLTDQFHITGVQNSASDCGIALNGGIFGIRVSAGVTVRGILGNCLNDDGFIMLHRTFRSCGFCLRFEVCGRNVCPCFCIRYILGGQVPILCQCRQRIGRVLLCVIIYGSNRDRMGLTQLFHILFQCMSRDAAHIHSSRSAGKRSCGQIEIKQSGGNHSVLSIHLKEVAHLIQHNISGMIVLNIVVAPNRFVRCDRRRDTGFDLCLFTLVFLIFSDRFRGQISAFTDQIIHVFDYLIPVQLHNRAVTLLIYNPFAVVIFTAAGGTGQSVRAAAGAVFLFQKSGFFRRGMVFMEIVVNASGASFKVTSTGYSFIDFILRDKHIDCGDFCHVRHIFAARQRQFFQFIPELLRLVVAEAKQGSILRVCRIKCSKLIGKGLPEHRFLQRFRKSGSGIGKTTHTVIGQC